jgi:hypothetical protein
MIRKQMLAIVGVVALAAGLFMVSPAAAKKGCGKICKDNFAACKTAAKTANNCKGLKGDEKKSCKTALKTALGLCKEAHKTRLAECKAAADEATVTCDAASPSGAFLN